jgi:hypothetical protein
MSQELTLISLLQNATLQCTCHHSAPAWNKVGQDIKGRLNFKEGCEEAQSSPGME